MGIRVWLQQRKGWPTLAAGLVLALAALVPMALLSFGPFQEEAFSGDPCDNPGLPPPAPAGQAPAFGPAKDRLPSLPPGAIQLPSFDPAKPESRPELPAGWVWDADGPVPLSGRGAVVVATEPDGRSQITLLPDEAIVSWDDPDRPQDLPWYDPATDPCR